MCHTLLEINVHLNLDMKMLRKHLHTFWYTGIQTLDIIYSAVHKKSGCFDVHVWQPGIS